MVCALAGLEADPDEGRAEAVAASGHAETAAATFRQDGDVWTLAFDGLSVQLTHQKGFSDLARLLARPGVEMHCLELADRPAETGGDAPVLDERARREMQARVRELQQEIDEADAAHDLARAERAREELDRIVEHLSGALGLGGRCRAARQRGRTCAVGRDLAHPQRHQEDRAGPPASRPPPREQPSAPARSASTSRKRRRWALTCRSLRCRTASHCEAPTLRPWGEPAEVSHCARPSRRRKTR